MGKLISLYGDISEDNITVYMSLKNIITLRIVTYDDCHKVYSNGLKCVYIIEYSISSRILYHYG